MLVHKRPLLVRMALEADRILRGRSSHLLGLDRAVRIVTVRALDQPLVHSMMEWHFELSFLLEMARVTELWLRFDKQEFFRFGMMRRVAGDATNVILRVLRIDCIHVLCAAGVACQTLCVDFLGGRFFKEEELGGV